MTNIFRILHLLAIYSSISLIRAEPPMIFNGDTLEIYPDWETATKHDGPYAIACPASYEREQEFNKDGSLDDKALFVKGYSESTVDYSYLLYTKCGELFKLAAVIRKDPISKEEFVEFGYEVYNDKTEVNVRFKEFDFKLFRRLLPPASFIQRGIDFVRNLGDDNTPHVEKDNSDDVFEGPLQYDLDFIWFSRAFMKYEFSTWNVEILTYFITQNANDLLAECKNKAFGMQFYGEDNVYKYYIDVFQKVVFKDVDLPEHLLKDKGECQVHSLCVAPYALLSPYQFQTFPSEAISCSSLVEIPVWYETAEEPLNYSEKFLVAAAQVANQRLKIIVGTYETLTLPAKTGNKSHKMFLHGKKMPIPKIIFKIVKFKSHDCNAERSTCWFDVVIVIHNQPKVKKEDVICDDISEEWGWDSIRYMSTTNKSLSRKSAFIYVCELNMDLQTKLDYKTDTPLKGNLKLNLFPYYNKNKTRIEFENWQEKFETRMRELFEETPGVDSNKLETQKEP